MSKHICIIDAHPDADPARYVHALCTSYALGAESAGHHVDSIRIADLDIKPLDCVASFAEPPSDLICNEREKIVRAEHIVLAFPLWLGSMPSAARAFFEQAACGAFFIDTASEGSRWPRKMMKGRSARVIVTMGMPAFVYKTLMGSGSLRALERGMLGVSGFKPIRHSILGGVESVAHEVREKWLTEMHKIGSKAS